MKINPKFFQEAKPAQIPDTTPKELWKTKRSAERYIEHFREVTKKEKANMDKPLKDWTLEECKAYCSEKYGAACFNDDEINDCVLEKCGLCCSEPKDMDLLGKPRFTEQEVEDAKYIKRILKVDLVSRNQYGNGLVAKRDDDSVSVVVNSEMFPSIRPGQSYSLDEIIGNTKNRR